MGGCLGVTVNVKFVPECDGLSCTYTEEKLRLTSASSPLTDNVLDTSKVRTILTKNGITTFEGRGSNNAGNGDIKSSYRTYGAWMEHAAFGVLTEDARGKIGEKNIKLSVRYGIAGGTPTGSRPTADATWKGLMVGTPKEGKYHGNFLQGDAVLNYDLDTTKLDATFSDIKDLARGKDYETPEVIFADVSVREDGSYGVESGEIYGGFGGPKHEETAGVFDKSGIVGAYGAKIDTE